MTRNRRKNYRQFRFSLIEMAAVIVIVSIVAGISITAFVKITKGKNVENSAVIIGSMLKAVRSYAITYNCYAALVFVTNETTGTNPELPYDYRYRSYRACVVTSSKAFDSWIKDEKWEFLPSGASIVAVSNSNSTPPSTDYATAFNAISSIGIPTGKTPFYNMLGGNYTLSPASMKGIVFTPTGDISGNTAYVFIGETIYITESIPDNKRTNITCITIDKFTGRVSYGGN